MPSLKGPCGGVGDGSIQKGGALSNSLYTKPSRGRQWKARFREAVMRGGGWGGGVFSPTLPDWSHAPVSPGFDEGVSNKDEISEDIIRTLFTPVDTVVSRQ